MNYCYNVYQQFGSPGWTAVAGGIDHITSNEDGFIRSRSRRSRAGGGAGGAAGGAGAAAGAIGSGGGGWVWSCYARKTT